MKVQNNSKKMSCEASRRRPQGLDTRIRLNQETQLLPVSPPPTGPRVGAPPRRGVVTKISLISDRGKYISSESESRDKMEISLRRSLENKKSRLFVSA